MAVPPVSLSARHLVRSFRQGDEVVEVIRDVSLEVLAGRLVLLMGPSGSGKSTLLALLSGLLRPDRGEVVALGQPLARLSEDDQLRFRRRHCGFVFQGFNLLPSLTAREQLEMFVEWTEGRAADGPARVSAMLDRLGLTHRADVRVDRLSGGEKQRIAIGRALLKAPALLFADEPTSSLDWAHGERVIELLRTASHARGATTFIVGHDTRLIPYADLVLQMQDGMIRPLHPSLPDQP
ncbi:MAG: ABC transporter ATP-binding protein [Gemmataceae bacterium]